MERRQIVIVGGGFAGVWAALGAAAALRQSRAADSVSITVVSPELDLVIRPRLYEKDLSGVRVPLRGILAPLGIDHLQATVEAIEPGRRELALAAGAGEDRLGYDQLVLCAGSRLCLPELSAEVHCVDGYEQAVALHRAVALGGPPQGRFAATVVGAGFTGIELAAELADVVRAAARAAAAPVPETPICLVDQAESVAPEFGPRARAVIESALGSLGVRIRTGVSVDDVDADGPIVADGERLESGLTAWATGPRASALNQQLGLPVDRLGRLPVDERMWTGLDGVWAAGDSARVSVDGEHLASMSCQQAMPQGRQAGENAAAAVLGRPPGRYRQPLYLTCLDLGSAGAMLTCGFERDAVLASGADGKRFKRFINRSLIYPPKSERGDAALLELGRSAPAGKLGAAVQRLALRSAALRNVAVGRAEDRAEQHSERTVLR